MLLTNLKPSVPAAIIISAVILAGAWVWTNGTSRQPVSTAVAAPDAAALEAKILPSEGKKIPVTWGDLGKRMVDAGIIDPVKFAALYAERGGLNPDEKLLLEGAENGQLTITPLNAGFLLNLLWAVGLGNKNPVLEQGSMVDKQYGGPSGFASTGGWTLARGGPMLHYSMHTLVTLTPDQQALVERVAKGIYRPCCGNSTFFPDCNHGMAMLGLLELMASQGASEDQMFRTALDVNTYWFPDTYLTIAKYMATKNISWDATDPRTILGADYSSAQGFQRVSSELAPTTGGGGGSCGV